MEYKAHTLERLYLKEKFWSPEYQKYVKDDNFGGKIEYFGLPVGDEEVVMSTHGFMYSMHGKERMPVSVVYQILKNLIECHALVYETTMDTTFSLNFGKYDQKLCFFGFVAFLKKMFDEFQFIIYILHIRCNCFWVFTH